MIMKKTLLIAMLALLGMAQARAQADGYLPVVREGVQWVNEKVIVSGGDTTRYFYKYEFSGLDYTMHINRACYYYTGDYLDVESDSLIAGMMEGYYGNYVTCFRNNPLKKMRSEGRRMLHFSSLRDGGTTLLYLFGNHCCDEYYLEMTEYGLKYYGLEPFLTRKNFIEIDPVTIEGTECERYAYLDDDGNTLAFVVEGIGFDSRNLGDLLSPFTRRPDPTDDYQEWCGLSHVIKDGEIIYKGLRYGYREKPDNSDIRETYTDNNRSQDPNYYDLLGHRMGTQVPSVPGIYIHKGEKIIIR